MSEKLTVAESSALNMNVLTDDEETSIISAVKNETQNNDIHVQRVSREHYVQSWGASVRHDLERFRSCLHITPYGRI